MLPFLRVAAFEVQKALLSRYLLLIGTNRSWLSCLMMAVEISIQSHMELRLVSFSTLSSQVAYGNWWKDKKVEKLGIKSLLFTNSLLKGSLSWKVAVDASVTRIALLPLPTPQIGMATKPAKRSPWSMQLIYICTRSYAIELWFKMSDT